MKYICDKIISITKFENLYIYFKTRVVYGFFWGESMCYNLDFYEYHNDKFFGLDKYCCIIYPNAFG
jgi:hypothetical protein